MTTTRRRYYDPGASPQPPAHRSPAKKPKPRPPLDAAGQAAILAAKERRARRAAKRLHAHDPSGGAPK